GQYVLNVQMSLSSSTNSSSNSDLRCRLITRRSANNIYIPLIVGGNFVKVEFPLIALIGSVVVAAERTCKSYECVVSCDGGGGT
ncbi:unnamed protein product, partial [Rotaria sp. Silwood1]